MNENERWVWEWFKKADNDLRAARGILLLDDPPFDTICFHAQQCAEACRGHVYFCQEA